MSNDDPITRAYLVAAKIDADTRSAAARPRPAAASTGAAGRAEAERRFGKKDSRPDPIAAAILKASTNDQDIGQRIREATAVELTASTDKDLHRDLARRRNDSHLW